MSVWRTVSCNAIQVSFLLTHACPFSMFLSRDLRTDTLRFFRSSIYSNEFRYKYFKGACEQN